MKANKITAFLWFTITACLTHLVVGNFSSTSNPWSWRTISNGNSPSIRKEVMIDANSIIKAGVQQDDCDSPKGGFFPIFENSKFFMEIPPEGQACVKGHKDYLDLYDECKRSGLTVMDITDLADLRSIQAHVGRIGNYPFPMGIAHGAVDYNQFIYTDTGRRIQWLYTNREMITTQKSAKQTCFQLTPYNDRFSLFFDDVPCGSFDGPNKWEENCLVCQHPTYSTCYNNSVEEQNREKDEFLYVGTVNVSGIPNNLHFHHTQKTYPEAVLLCAQQHHGRLLSEQDNAGSIVQLFWRENSLSVHTVLWLLESKYEYVEDECLPYSYVVVNENYNYAMAHRNYFPCSKTPMFFFCVEPEKPLYPEHVCEDIDDYNYHLVPCQCKRYFRCFHGRYTEYECPGGLEFNHVTQQCDFPDRNRCDPNRQPPEPQKNCPCPCIYKNVTADCSDRYIYQERVNKDDGTTVCEQNVRKCEDNLVWKRIPRDHNNGGLETGVCDKRENVPGC